MAKDDAAALKKSRSVNDVTRIINYFLNLYRLQLGASYSAQDPTEVIPLHASRTSPVKDLNCVWSVRDHGNQGV